MPHATAAGASPRPWIAVVIEAGQRVRAEVMLAEDSLLTRVFPSLRQRIAGHKCQVQAKRTSVQVKPALPAIAAHLSWLWGR